MPLPTLSYRRTALRPAAVAALMLGASALPMASAQTTDADATQLPAVTISGRTTATNFVFTITDTGIGIPQRDIQKLGRPFEQVENQFTKSRGGSGLGLAISRSLVELHNGTLDIVSVVGRGTTVTVTLPSA